MNIAFITPEYVFPDRFDGGLANYIFKVAHGLTRLGHRVSVFVLSHQDCMWIDGQVKIIEVKRAISPRFLIPTKLKWFYATLLPAIEQIRSARRLAKYVWDQHKTERFDILQTSSYLTPGYALRKNGLIPLVCRVSSYTPLVRSAYGSQRSSAEYLCDWMEIRQVIDADAAFAPSQFCISLFERLEAYKPDFIQTPADTIKIEPDDSIYEKELSGIHYFLFFGTLSKIKGVDLIADAIPTIIKANPGIHFVFVGRDDGMPDGSKMIDYILQKNKEYQTNIHYNTAVPKAQLYSIISHATAVLMPSRADNYPNACLEAQMLGVPVIGSRESSLEEMVEDGKTGFLCEQNDAKTLGNAMMRMLALGDSDYQNMKKANVEHYEKILRENRIEELVNYYQHVIGEYWGHNQMQPQP